MASRVRQVIGRPDDPAAARGLLVELIEAGVTHLVLVPSPPWPAAPARWLANEIAAPVAAEVAIG
jgi:hypothetical protein